MSLRCFTLFSGNKDIRVEFSKPVFCLAGANGLGKSTFLTVVLYGLTGLVREPSYRLRSVEEFERDNVGFAKEYFSGRIVGGDRDSAEVEIVFELGAHTLSVRRGFFSSQVVDWSVRGPEGDSPSDATSYEAAVCSLTGLGSFGQFSFLIHYVLAFDEHRELLFWNPALLTSVLYLLVGWDPQEAMRADHLAREVEKVDSRVRNLQWDITKSREYISKLQQDYEKASDEAEDARGKHRQLHDEVRQLQEKVDIATKQRLYVSAQIAERDASLNLLRSRYSQLFNQLLRSAQAYRLGSHPIIQRAIASGVCELCGAQSPAVARAVSELLDSADCPLCRSLLVRDQGAELPVWAELASLDQELTAAEKALDTLRKEQTELALGLEEMSTALEAKASQLLELDALPTDLGASGAGRSEAIDVLVNAQRQNMDAIRGLKERAQQERKRLKNELLTLRQRLKLSYREAELDFVPKFRALAMKFTGLEVGIQLEEQIVDHKPQIRLVLELGDTQRQQSHQLSESQRFFLDIALRMAFVLHVSQEAGMMLIDTPEGSLDIAYETNAGQMLSDFALQGRQLILTANINSSGLLRTMARTCGSSHLELQRMIDWATLSEVQAQHADLFERELGAIRAAMGERDDT